MARGTFSTLNYLSASQSVITDYPCSFFSWWNTASNTAGQQIVGVADTGTTNNYLSIDLGFATANDPVQLTLNVGGTFGSAGYNTTTGPTNEWHSTSGMAASTTLREVQYDLNDGTDSTTTRNFPSGVDVISVGVRITSSSGLGFNGYLAEVGVWNVSINEFERDSLHHGCSPMLVRPTALKGYYPCFAGFSSGNEANWANALPHLTETGTVGTGAAHPAVTLAYPVP